MSPRKLILWLSACTLTVCVLRAGSLTGADQCIYHLRNMHASTFAYRYDDFLPYLPTVVMFILKLVGVKSRSNWKRMLISAALAYVLMGVVVISMKSLADTLRPDGSGFLSFPLGRTATAFMAATLLYEEHSLRTPSTTIATFLPVVVTGFICQSSNCHWPSDILASAIIDIVMVELAYFLTNLVFRRESDTHACPKSQEI